MGLLAEHISVGTVVAKIVSSDKNPQSVWLHNHEHANNHEIYLGGAAVTTSTGIHLQHTETMQMVIPPGDELYAIADGDARELHVLIWSR